jgi:hypothetical protein
MLDCSVVRGPLNRWTKPQTKARFDFIAVVLYIRLYMDVWSTGNCEPQKRLKS